MPIYAAHCDIPALSGHCEQFWSGLTFRRLSPSWKNPVPSADCCRAGGAAERVEVTLSRTGNSGGIGFQSQRFELAATPIGVQVSQAFDDEAARQSTLYRCPDQLGREKARESVKLI